MLHQENEVLRCSLATLQAQVLKESNAQKLAEATEAAAKAHCALRAHENEVLLEQLNKKSQKKWHTNVHTDARCPTAPEYKAAFEAEECDHLTKEKAASDKAAQKETALCERNLEWHRNAVFKTFDTPLGLYKKKDNLRDIAVALSLDDDGTIVELTAHIKDALEKSPQHALNPRFTALYSTGRHTCKTHKGDASASNTMAGNAIVSDDHRESNAESLNVEQHSIAIDPLLL